MVAAAGKAGAAPGGDAAPGPAAERVMPRVSGAKTPGSGLGGSRPRS